MRSERKYKMHTPTVLTIKKNRRFKKKINRKFQYNCKKHTI